MEDMPDNLCGEILPRTGGLAFGLEHRCVCAVRDGVHAVYGSVGGGGGRGRHCAGVTAIWEVTDRDDRVSHR